MEQAQEKTEGSSADRQISSFAQTVKYADILDNSQTLSKADDSFVETYLRESLAILNLANKGDQRLYNRVMDHVTNALRELSS